MPQPTLSQQMRKLVSAYHSSGQSQRSFAQAHGLTEGKLHYWVKKFSKEPSTGPQGAPSFIPLEVTAPGVPMPSAIMIRMPNGLEIQIPV